MSLSCRQMRGLFEDYAAEAMAPADRRELREHLTDCRACREEAGRSDPGLLLAGAFAEEVSGAEVSRIFSGVRAGIALRQAERRLQGSAARGDRERNDGGRRRLLGIAAAAVAVLTLLLPGSAPRRENPPSAARRGHSGTPEMGALQPAAVPVSLPAGEIPKSKFPSEATVYDWNLGSGQTRVVWIVDRSLDI